MEIALKAQLDLQVAELLGKKTREVSAITATFLHEVARALADSGHVRLNGLGDLRVICRRGVRQRFHRTSFKGKKDVVAVPRKYYVSFKKALQLTALLQERHPRKDKAMEKFGVDEGTDQEKLEKAAADGCPLCGKKPVRHGSVLMCPEHGSEPFEKKPA